MSSALTKYGNNILVTGASSGIGKAFVEKLVSSGYSVVGVARRADRLEALSKELASKPGKFIPFVCDLGDYNSGNLIQNFLSKNNITIDVLINNAGFGLLGEFGQQDRERVLGMIDLNCRAVADLTHRLIPSMKERKKGAVIIVSSVVGSLPVPWFSTYAATKSFDLYFGEALHAEYKQYGVDVLTVLPGLTETEFQASSGMREYHSPYRSAENVVNSALNSIGRKSIVVDGWHNKLLVHGMRFLPRGLVLKLSKLVMKFELKN